MEEKFTKSEIIEAMKDVVKPILNRLDRIEDSQDRMEGSLNRMADRQDKMEGSLNRMADRQDKMEGSLNRMADRQDKMEGSLNRIERDLQSFKEKTAKQFSSIEHELAKKPDRDEVKRILEDTVRNYPFYYLVDRDKIICYGHLEEIVRRVVREEMQQTG